MHDIALGSSQSLYYFLSFLVLKIYFVRTLGAEHLAGFIRRCNFKTQFSFSRLMRTPASEKLLVVAEQACRATGVQEYHVLALLEVALPDQIDHPGESLAAVDRVGQDAFEPGQ